MIKTMVVLGDFCYCFVYISQYLTCESGTLRDACYSSIDSPLVKKVSNDKIVQGGSVLVLITSL